MAQVSGVTGEALVHLLSSASRDYKGDIRLPSADAAREWVISRTTPRNGGNHCQIWTLATMRSASQARCGYPAYAEDAMQYEAVRNYHPSLRDLRDICERICFYIGE